MISINQLLGVDSSQIDFESLEAPLHRKVVPAFVELQCLAKHAGFDLAIASSYRDFFRQRSIWDAKLEGGRPVFDSQGERLIIDGLSPWQRIESVLRWSALPGASRHHWGTDIDIYDRAAVPCGYQVQLSNEEVMTGGPFAPMHDWLDSLLRDSPELGFFRPYDKDRGGVAPERWHLSYAPVAVYYQQKLKVDDLLCLYSEYEISHRKVVMEYMETIFKRFIAIPTSAYPIMFQSILV